MAEVTINTTAGDTPIAKITQFKYGSNGKTCTYDGTKVLIRLLMARLPLVNI